MTRKAHVFSVSTAVGAMLLGTAVVAALTQHALAQQPGAKPAPTWIKLCEKVQYLEPDPKDAKKPLQKERSICHTHHERLDASTGAVMVSVAIREIEGNDKKALMVMVPLGMAISQGVQLGFYPPVMWAAIQKGEPIDDSKIEPLKMGFTMCHAGGCSAELDATPEVIKRLQTSGGLVAFAVNGSGSPVAFPAPLNGFSEALAGPSLDSKAYNDERRKLMEQLDINRKAALEEFRKQNKELQAIAPKGQGLPSAAATAAPPAAAPAAKKP